MKRKPFKFRPLPPVWFPKRLEYILFKFSPSAKKWHEAQVISIETHCITLIIFPDRSVQTFHKRGFEKLCKPDLNQQVMKNTFKKEPWTGIVGTYGQPETLGEMDSSRLEVRNTPQQSAITQEAWNSIERAEQKDAQDKADINDLNDAIWRAVWVAVGLGLAGLFYLAYHFRFQLDLLNLGAKL